MIQKYYEILGLQPGASITEIKKSYRKLVKLYHPDISGSNNTSENFILVNEAYRFLMNFKSKNLKQTLSYDEWTEKRRERARKQAAYQAKKKYDEFKNSKLYQTSKRVMDVFNYIYIFIGFVILLSPILYTIFYGLKEEKEAESIAFIITSFIVGSIIIIMIFLNRNKYDF